MEKFVCGNVSAVIHSTVSYCVVGERKKTAIDYGTASLDIDRELIRLEAGKYLTRLKITNTSGSMLKLMTAYPIITDNLSIGDIPSRQWHVLNGARQLNDVPASCITGERDNSFALASLRLLDEGMYKEPADGGDAVLYGDGITVIKAGKTYVSFEVLTNDYQLTDISISLDCLGSVKAIRAGGEFNCLMENGDAKYTDWVRICTGGNYARLIEEYALDRKAMCAGNIAKKKKNIYIADEDFSVEAMTNTLSFLKGLRAPFDYIELGKGWQSNIGDWEGAYGVNISSLSSRINQSGCKAGIWTAPFIADKQSELFETERKWFLRHADGSFCTYRLEDRDYVVLDVSSEEVLEWLSMLYQRLSAFGFYMHEIDHTMAFVIQKDVVLLDPRMSMAEAYRRAVRTIKEAIGDDGYLKAANGFIPSLSGIADCVQTVSDIETVKERNKSNVMPYLANQAVMRGYMSAWMHNSCADSIIDEDFLKKYSNAEIRNLLVCEYLSGGCAAVSNIKTNEQLKLMRSLIPFVKLNVCARDAFGEDAYISVVDAEVNGDFHTVCFFNNSFAEKELIFRLDSKICGGYADHASEYNVSSYFSRTRAKRCSCDDFIRLGSIPAHSCEIVKIAKTSKPQIILSDMHFSMGGEVMIDISDDCVFVTGNNPFNHKGVYTVALGKGYICTDGRDEFSFTVNGQGPFRYEKQIKKAE